MQEIRLSGIIGKEAQVKTTLNGRQFATFSLACGEKTGRTNQDGTDEYETTWWDVFCNVEDVQYLTKGRKVMVIGKPKIAVTKSKVGETYVNKQVSFANIYFAMQKNTANGNVAMNTNAIPSGTATPTPPQPRHKEVFQDNPAVSQMQVEFDAAPVPEDDLPF